MLMLQISHPCEVLRQLDALYHFTHSVTSPASAATHLLAAGAPWRQARQPRSVWCTLLPLLEHSRARASRCCLQAAIRWELIRLPAANSSSPGPWRRSVSRSHSPCAITQWAACDSPLLQTLYRE